MMSLRDTRKRSNDRLFEEDGVSSLASCEAEEFLAGLLKLSVDRTEQNRTLPSKAAGGKPATSFTSWTNSERTFS